MPKDGDWSAGWTSSGSQNMYTLNIDPKAGDNCGSEPPPWVGTAETIDSVTVDSSTGLVTDITVDNVTYTRNASIDTGSL